MDLPEGILRLVGLIFGWLFGWPVRQRVVAGEAVGRLRHGRASLSRDGLARRDRLASLAVGKDRHGIHGGAGEPTGILVPHAAGPSRPHAPHCSGGNHQCARRPADHPGGDQCRLEWRHGARRARDLLRKYQLHGQGDYRDQLRRPIGHHD